MVHGEIWPRETEKITLPFTILTTWYYRKKI